MAKKSRSKARYRLGRTPGPNQFRNWRKYRDLTQDQLAERIKTTKTRVSRKENSLEPYDEYYLQALAEALGASIMELLSVNPMDEKKSLAGDLRAAVEGLKDDAQRQRALDVLKTLLIVSEPPDDDPDNRPPSGPTIRLPQKSI